MRNNEFSYLSGFLAHKELPLADLMPKGPPFLMKHSDIPSNSIVVCLHGYTATTYVVQPIARAIFQNHIDTVAPLLPGHGLNDIQKAKLELNKVHWQDWLHAARYEVETARKSYQHVFVYGQSLGGALALCMAAEGLVDGCAVSAAAVNANNFIKSLLALFGWIPLNIPVHVDLPYITEAYPFTGIRGSQQTMKLGAYLRQKINQIACPIFIGHSKKDPLLNPKIPAFIRSQVHGECEIHWYDESGHTIPLDCQGEQLAHDIAVFFQKISQD